MFCRGSRLISSHPIAFAVIFVAAVVFVALRFRSWWRRRSSFDARGEYRAVAATFDETFDAGISDDEVVDDDEYDAEATNGWNQSNKRSIEMSSLDLNGEQNGGLTLEEMNG